MNKGSTRPQVVSALLDPSTVLDFNLREWNDLLRHTEKHGLIARLGVVLTDRGLLQQLPGKARARLHAACIAAESTQTAVRFEINRVLRALARPGMSVILLKGAAYMMAGLPPSRGRYVGDLDIMVPAAQIAEVEQSLLAQGWALSALEEYDLRYYRQWMHEIPPLQHPQRETPVDLHHTILPLTSRAHVNAAALVEASLPLEDPRLRVLGPADMVLHSAVHLFNDEVGKPLRDLFDLHDLICHFGAQSGFWDDLLRRAQLHGLERPLYYTLREAWRLFAIPVPAHIENAVAAFAPAPLISPLMDWLLRERFEPAPPATRYTGAVAEFLLYLRAHWFRMPLLLLVRHLATKAIMRIRKRYSRSPEV